MKPVITVICPWYANTGIVRHQLNTWRGFPEALKDRARFILIDDGSPCELNLPDVDLNLTLARIRQDIPWNQPGARNLGAHLAKTDFLFFTDIDHEITLDAFKAAIDVRKSIDTVFLFRRWFNGKPHHSHPCSFVISKAAFEHIGGFDEDFSGNRGHDDTMFRMLTDAFLKRQMLDARLILHGDALTTGLDRDHRRNALLLQIKREQFQKGIYRNGRRLRFDWDVVCQMSRTSRSAHRTIPATTPYGEN